MGSRIGPYRDPLSFGEGIQVGAGSAKTCSGSEVAHPAEGDHCLVLDGLVVDVHDTAGETVGDLRTTQFQVGAFEVTRSGLTDLAACCG